MELERQLQEARRENARLRELDAKHLLYSSEADLITRAEGTDAQPAGDDKVSTPHGDQLDL